jgi:hypothetical protein
MERTEQSRPCTAVPQLTELAPRPKAPEHRLTARPLPRNLDPYKVPETVKPATKPVQHTPWTPSSAPLSRELDFDRSAYDRLQRRDRIGQPAAWSAFGSGGAA